MIRPLLMALVAVSATVAPLVAQGRGGAAAKSPLRGCQLDLLHFGSLHRDEAINLVALTRDEGQVHLACKARDLWIRGDSVESYGDYDRVTVVGAAKYHDDKYDITADTLRRYRVDERIEMRGHVHVIERKAKSTIDAPSIDYWPGRAGAKDSSSVLATGGVHALVYPVASPRDRNPKPYDINGERMFSFGSNRLDIFGNATVVHDSIRTAGDSIKYLTGKNGRAYIFGAPGRVNSVGSDSTQMQASLLELVFDGDEKLKEVRTSGRSVVTRAGARITADSMLMILKDDKVTAIHAWDRTQRAHLARDGYDAWGDSLAVDSRDDQISEVRLFKRGEVQQPVDTALHQLSPGDTTGTVDRDWLRGQRVTISFRQVDSAGTSLTLVSRLEAKTSSCSLYFEAGKGSGSTPPGSPSINYTCADNIIIRMKDDLSREVEGVRYNGNAVVNQLDPQRTVTRPPTGSGGGGR